MEEFGVKSHCHSRNARAASSVLEGLATFSLVTFQHRNKAKFYIAIEATG